MDINTAFRILDVSRNANYSEIKKKYYEKAKQFHPDQSGSKDASQFILLSIAFNTLRQFVLNDTTQTNEDNIPEEIEITLKIKSRIEKSFQMIMLKYRDYRNSLKNSTPKYIRNQIYSVNSSSRLRLVIEKDIKNHLTEAFKQIENYVQKLVDHEKFEDSCFLNNLFSDLYKARREYWLLNLHRDPFILFTFLALSLNFFAKNYFQVEDDFLIFFKDVLSIDIAVAGIIIIALAWSPLVFIISGLIYISINLYFLNPKRQFLPPRLSIPELIAFLNRESDNIELERSVNAFGHAVSLGTLGLSTLFIPVVGPAVGVAVAIGGLFIGGIWGWMSGKDLSEIKDTAYHRIIYEFEYALSQLDDRIEAWLTNSKEEIIKATEKSFIDNMKRITELLKRRQLSSKVINQKLLLPSSNNQGK